MTTTSSQGSCCKHFCRFVLRFICGNLLSLSTWIIFGSESCARATIETFGSLPQCSHLVTFMVFVIKVPALQPGKIIGLTASSVLLVMYTSISLHELFASVRRRRVKALIPHHLRTSTPRHSTLPTVQTPTTPAAVPSASLRRPPSLANISVVPRTATQTSILSPTEIVSLSSASGPSQSVLKRRPRRTQWSREVDPMFIGVVICQVLVFTYFIVSSELLLTNNYGAQDAAQQMGFGQPEDFCADCDSSWRACCYRCCKGTWLQAAFQTKAIEHETSKSTEYKCINYHRLNIVGRCGMQCLVIVRSGCAPLDQGA
ncbi:unnamed protein product [Mycena citricolor]|uniref:Uncharacterized protein n=1 Tax=Mycena citricolor TaxID=2018698 RepID=A0AAD2HR28_9AGAR|nr:unnamed protein product [Mycena citricolor]